MSGVDFLFNLEFLRMMRFTMREAPRRFPGERVLSRGSDVLRVATYPGAGSDRYWGSSFRRS